MYNEEHIISSFVSFLKYGLLGLIQPTNEVFRQRDLYMDPLSG